MKAMAKILSVFFLIIVALGCSSKKLAPTDAEAKLKSADPEIRRQVVVEISQSEDSRSVQLLISALKDENPGVRIEAAAALRKRKAREATSSLIEAVRDDNIWVRINAAEALGEIGAQEAVRPLVALTDSVRTTNEGSSNWSWSYGKDASAAAFALQKITGKDFGLDTQKWNAWLAQTSPQTK